MFGSMIDDDINEDDYRRYTGMQMSRKEKEDNDDDEPRGYRKQKAPKRVSFNGEEEEEQEQEDVSPKRKPVRSKRGPVALIEEEENDDAKSYLKGMDVSVPIARSSSSSSDVAVPYRVQQAAARILESDTMHRADKRVMQHLSMIANRPNEFCAVDPMVWMRGYIDTGTCRVCLCEALPISEYLLARALKLSYSVQITPKAKTPAQTYEDSAESDIILKPWTGDKPTAAHAQPYGCSEQVRAYMECNHPELIQQVEVYMYALGPLSPALVVENEWIEGQLSAMKEIISGKLVPMRAKKR